MEKFAKAINFEFASYEFNPQEGRAVFNYKTEFDGREPILWKEEIVLPEISQDILNELQNKNSTTSLAVEKLLQSLHIILGISYYKFYCATNIKLNYNLAKQEAGFWNIVYKKGLGEFFYRNKLDPKISPVFPYQESSQTRSTEKLNIKNNMGYLVGVSGGKDSIVSVELLKEAKENITAFNIETNKESELVNNVIKLTELPSLKVRRILDPKVFQEHQYNGHIPISAIYAFLGVFTALLYGYKGFVVSNESSSNFGNAKYKGLEINHQWSKTFEFEKLFNEYIDNFISQDLEYFSLLRPFYEIRIAEMFSKYPKYFSSFSSCNSNFKIKQKTNSLWCCACAKCVFAFTILSPFLNKKELLQIFGKDLKKDKNLKQLFKDISGKGKIKPFDCVGTFQEAQTALGIKKHPEVFTTQAENLIPEKFKFLGIKNALIMGYGKEGQITEKYLQKFYPNLKIKVAENIDSKNYIKKQTDFDIAIKTPGINKNLVKIPHTTATNIFLSRVIENNTVIGITGSKGKSTTSTLIYEILKDAGKDVEFLGNIGKPMLEYLLENNPINKIFVLELSSYQLDDIKFSPHIAVVTNLFPEHLNYHGNLEKYYQAKKNIINFQKQNGHFIYNSASQESKKWLANYNGHAIGFDKSKLKSNLLGEHNKANIAAAIEVAKILNIPEESITKTVASFKGLEHRLEFVGEFSKIKFYDDAISTTPESTIEAIKALSPVAQIGTIFLGGEDRGYNFIELSKEIKKHKIKNIVLFPESGKKMKKILGKDFNFFETKDMKRAVKFAYKYTEKGSICLLSCASPSYSVWKNFEEKGNLFKKFVKQLSK